MSAEPLRILTIRQPWAWAIIHGGKNVENRSRNIAGNYRGPVAIHAGRAFDIMDLATPEIVGAVFAARLEYGTGDPRTFKQSSPRGAIIGVVDLVDVHMNEIDPWAEPPITGCSAWAEPNVHHLVLENPRALATPIPFKGALGLRKLDAETEAHVWDEVRNG